MTMCQGNVALITDDLPAAIRRFGTVGRIHFVHFRDVGGRPSGSSRHSSTAGPTDMAACIRAYLGVGGRRAAPDTSLARADRRRLGQSPGIRPCAASTPSGTCRGCSPRRRRRVGLLTQNAPA